MPLSPKCAEEQKLDRPLSLVPRQIAIKIFLKLFMHRFKIILNIKSTQKLYVIYIIEYNKYCKLTI